MNLHVETFGADGSPKLLMLHGSGAPPRSLHTLALALADDYFVILPHRNGYGRTGIHAYDPQAELNALLRLVGDSAIVIGHSFGAFRAFQLAALAPGRISQVIAIGPIAGLPEEARQGVEALAEMLRTQTDVTEAIASTWLTPLYQVDHPSILETLDAWFVEVDREIAIYENFEFLDQGATLQAFVASEVPAKLYVGDIDLATPPVLARLIATHAPNATLTVVEDMGHLPMIEDFAGSLAWIRKALGS